MATQIAEQPPMAAQIEAAEQRLEQAFARLEAALEDNRGAPAAETERLMGELSALRADHAAIKQTAATVSRRLDVAIGKLRLVLED